MSYLINSSDIFQTIEMIDQQHLDVRTITMGLSLLDCADPDMDVCCGRYTTRSAAGPETWSRPARTIEREFGIPIVNKRISVTPIAHRGRQLRGGRTWCPWRRPWTGRPRKWA
jgi:uncharacterized protein (UPF0210 family)